MKTYTAKELKEILELHKQWLNDNGGSRANLGSADLRGANLSNANLRGAHLGKAVLRGADLGGADLGNSNLSNANLRGANLGSADLRGAHLGKAVLRGADLRGADLRGAYLGNAYLGKADLGKAVLRDADLGGADLRGADLRGVFGNMEHVKSLQTEMYSITYTSEIIQIGCQRHTIEEWKNFNDRRILEMDGKKALEWWKKWKPILMQIIEMSPCTPTKI